MANPTAPGTLTPGDVTTVTVNANSQVEVINRTGTDEIWFTVGTPTEELVAPTVGGAGCYLVPAGVCSYVVPGLPSGSAVVSMISNSAENYAVIGS